MSQSQNIRTSLAPVPASAGKRSGLGLIGSLLLHGAVIAATLFTWQHRLDITDQAPPVVPVELVTIGDKTDIKAVVPKEDKIKLPEKDTAVEAPKVDDAPPPPPQNMAAPKVEVAPPPPKPDAAPPAKQAKSEPVVAPVPAPPVPHMRPRPPAPKKKRAKFDVNKIMALLDKQKPTASKARGEAGRHAHKGIGAQNAMTMDLQDAMLNQIEACWSPPVGAPNAAELIVSFEVFLNRDGSVARPPRLTGQSGSGPYAAAAVEAARRAIFTCAPYKLPLDHYSDWRDFTMKFDPRKMMGQ